jgi:uncharacterized membrane protein
MSGALTALTVATALGCGLVGGVFFAFSTFVMQGLGRLTPSQGVAAMQAINVTAVTFAFMLLLFGTAALSVVVGIWAVVDWQGDTSPYLLAGALLYLAGIIVVTIAYNVPRNDALAALDPEDPAAAGYWARYRSEWTGANHVRTATGLAAAASLTLALIAG